MGLSCHIVVVARSLSRISCRRAWTGVAELDVLPGAPQLDDALDEDAGGMDVIGIDLASGPQMFDFCNGNLRGGRHDRVKIPRGLAIDQIASGVALPGVDDGEIGE